MYCRRNYYAFYVKLQTITSIGEMGNKRFESTPSLSPIHTEDSKEASASVTHKQAHIHMR
jgi:hypothetical protein